MLNIQYRSAVDTLQVQKTLLQSDLLQNHLGLSHLLHTPEPELSQNPQQELAAGVLESLQTFMLSGRPRDRLFSVRRLSRDSTVSSRDGLWSNSPP